VDKSKRLFSQRLLFSSIESALALSTRFMLDGEGNCSAFRGRSAEPPQLSRTGSRHARTSAGVCAVPLTIFNSIFMTELQSVLENSVTRKK